MLPLGGNDSWDFYQDIRGEWRWRRVGQNGEVVSLSPEGYAKKEDCLNSARRCGYRG
jgi:uncharacterized protein YegP (UPF0339 family)